MSNEYVRPVPGAIYRTGVGFVRTTISRSTGRPRVYVWDATSGGWKVNHYGSFTQLGSAIARGTVFRATPDEIASLGQESGKCGICNRALTDPVSRSIGYGETCAANWKLPWRGHTVVTEQLDFVSI